MSNLKTCSVKRITVYNMLRNNQLTFRGTQFSTTSAPTKGSRGTKKRLVMGSLENLTKEQVIPDVIDTKPTASIQIKYLSSNVEVQQGNELKPVQVKDMPHFEFEANPDKFYTLAMVDPDAPSRAEPTFREILHFLVANIPGKDVSKGDTLAEYIGSGAPKGTNLHRYVFLLYEQTNGKLNSGMKISKTSREGRVKFSIKNFAKANNLGQPVAANFFQAQYDDYVPQLHAQLAQG